MRFYNTSYVESMTLLYLVECQDAAIRLTVGEFNKHFAAGMPFLRHAIDHGDFYSGGTISARYNSSVGGIPVRFGLAAIAAGMLLSAGSAQAVPFTFAQYEQKTTPDTFRVTNGTGSAGTVTTIGSPIVNFSFLLPSLQAAGLHMQDAYMSLTGTISTPASIMVQPGPDPINQLIDSGILSFSRVTAAPEGTGNGARTNLLTISFTNALLTGFLGSTSGSLLASTPESEILFTSDFLNFDDAATLDFAIALSSIVNTNSSVAGLSRASTTESVRAFTADSTGTFSSDPRPTYVNDIPEPAAIGLMGLGLFTLGWRRRRSA